MSKETIKSLALDHITIDTRLQMRESVCHEHIGQMADVLKEGRDLDGDLPAIFYDGQTNWLADGFQRHAAHGIAGVKKMKCLVRNGTFADALNFAFGANARHGLRRTNADKRKAVTIAVATHPGKNLRDIAALCGVSLSFVSNIKTGRKTPTKADSAVHGEQRTEPEQPKQVPQIDIVNTNGGYEMKPGDPPEFALPMQKSIGLMNAVIDAIGKFSEHTDAEIAELVGCSEQFAEYIRNKHCIEVPFKSVGKASTEPSTDEGDDAPEHDGDHTGGGPVGVTQPEQPADAPIVVDGPKDRLQRPLPEHLVEVFADAKRIGGYQQTLGAMLNDLEQINETSIGKHFNIAHIRKDGKNLQNELKHARPYCVCPACSGSGQDADGTFCGLCKGPGFICRGNFDTLTADMQATAKSFIKGDSYEPEVD